MVNIVQSLRIAVGSIRSARMRSILTALGIVIGVAAALGGLIAGIYPANKAAKMKPVDALRSK